MSYASRQSMIDRFGLFELIQLTDAENGAAINEAVLAAALTDADAEINSYLASRYTLPLAQTTSELTRLACDIARYRLFDQGASESVKTRYDDAIRKLRDVSKGVASLGIDQGAAPLVSFGGAILQSVGKVFGRSTRG